MKNTLFNLFVVLAVAVPALCAAQSSSINAFSPYTMYGIGEMNTQGTLAMRSMGGAGVALRHSGTINLLNPASYSIAPRKTFLFDFGVEGQNYYNAQTVDGVNKTTAYNTFNFHDVAFQFPLAKGLGLGFSLTPYSSTGYRIKGEHTYAPDDPVWGNVGRVQYTYEGEGDVTEVKVGIGWELFKNFSLGAALQYYWGDIDRTFIMTPTPVSGEGNFSPIVGIDNYSISRFKGQVGVQWNAIANQRRLLTFGATYDIGGELDPRVSKRVYIGDYNATTVKGDTTHLSLVLPSQVSAGIFYRTPKIALGLDYVYQNWGSSNTTNTELTGISGPDHKAYTVAYTDTHSIRFGVEYTPERYDVRHFFKRWSYRAGFRYGDYNQTFDGNRISQYAVTLGFGIPVRIFAVSSIDVGFEYGRRGYNVADRVGLVRQQYFKFALGFTLFAAGRENHEYWFQRPKYD